MKKQIECLIIVICCSVFCNAPQAISQTISYFDTGEEFSGALPGWKNIKTDFGAKGDGITDDAPTISAALYTFRDMVNINNSVLYFPAGTYRLGSTIFNADRAGGGTDYAGLVIVGEDPSNTILLWDGPDEGTMFKLDGWYLKVSRLTFDGRNKAKTGLFRCGTFGTGVEYSDLVFKDLIWGVLLGDDTSAGQAENLFLRCKFYNCDCGIHGPNMNSLDTWLWYCLFQDCSYGIHCGGYQAYGNVFLRSKVVDMGLSWQPSCIVNNISVNPVCFNNYSQSALFQGNKIYDPDTSVLLTGNILPEYLVKVFTAPYTSVLLDNIIKTRGDAGSVIQLCDGKCISVGNTFTQLWPIRPRYREYSRWDSLSMHYVKHSVDGRTETIFRGPLWGTTPGIIWNCPLGKPKVAVKYSLISANGEPAWYLKSFRLRGSNDWGYHYTVLDSQINQSWTNGETKTFTFENTTPFAIYRLEVIELSNGCKAGDAIFFDIAEFSLTDTGGVNLMNDSGFVASGDEKWGRYYSLQEKQIPCSSVSTPEIIELPGTPPLVSRRIFEVRKGMPDDATEIQNKIDSAAALPPGTPPIVHIPKGTYSINKTIVLPADVDMTLSGDGIYGGATHLVPDPGLSGPTIRISAPSHLLIRDITIRGDEAIYAEVDDQPGSRVTGTLFMFGGGDINNMANIAMIIDGVEQSYMLFSGVNIGSCYNGVLVKGGPVLSSGGSTEGQIAFLSGASGFGQNMWETQKNGKLITQGMWFEANLDRTKSFINLTGASSGSMAISGMFWHYIPYPDQPIVSIDNFTGNFTAIANYISGYDMPQWWRITGDGDQGRILSACNDWFLGTDSAALADKWPYWVDETSPSANASRIFCEGPDITNKIMNELPDSSSLLTSLELMRSLRIKKPTAPLPGESHLDFVRVLAYGMSGTTAVRFIASPDPYGRPGSPTLISPLNYSTNITANPTMTWNESTGSTSYYLQVSTNTAFNQIVFEDSTISTTNQEIGPLIDKTVYYWRVLAKNSNGSSIWSPVWSFTTGTSTSVEQISTEIPTKFYLGNNYPNPFYLNTSIVYSIPLKAKVTLMLFDTWGREIATLVNEEQIAGKYEVKVDGSKLPGGIYFYRMQVGAYSATRRMVLIK
jgi:hypothetical protein